ncbi:MAG: hypothetical protein KF893_25545 [Caldilineaceae bacterium]|nr:hypothetical protein [Caldilineaceae bacterium]
MDHDEQVTALAHLQPGAVVDLFFAVGIKGRLVAGLVIDQVLADGALIVHKPGGDPVRFSQIVAVKLSAEREGEEPGDDEPSDLSDWFDGINFDNF